MGKGILANSAFNAAAGLSLLATGFVCSIVTARLLGPEANGMIAYSLWLAATAALVAELGTGVLLLRILPQLRAQGYSDDDRRGFAAWLLWPVVGSTLLLLALYGVFFVVAEAEHWAETAPSVVVMTGLLFLLQSIGMFTKNYLIGDQRVDVFFRMTITAGLLQLAGVVIGGLVLGVPGALAGYCLAYISQFLFALLLLRQPARKCGIGLRYLVGSSLFLSLQFLVDSVFLNRIELFFLERFQGVAAVGYYAVAFSLTNLALQVPIQLSGSLVPYYSEHLQRNPGQRLPIGLFAGAVRSLAYFTLPMSFGLAVISDRLVVLVFGEAFLPSGAMLMILALGVPSAVASQIATQYLFALDKIRERLLVGVVGAVVMVVGDALLVPHYGGEGAALVRLVAFTVMTAAMLRWMRFEGSVRPLLGSLAKIGLAAGICACAAGLVQWLLPGNLGLGLGILAAVAVYGLALTLLRAVPRQDAEVINGFLERLPGWLARPARNLVLRMARA